MQGGVARAPRRHADRPRIDASAPARGSVTGRHCTAVGNGAGGLADPIAHVHDSLSTLSFPGSGCRLHNGEACTLTVRGDLPGPELSVLAGIAVAVGSLGVSRSSSLARSSEWR